MKRNTIKIGMKPSHLGAFIKSEVVDELGLGVTKAGEGFRCAARYHVRFGERKSRALA